MATMQDIYAELRAHPEDAGVLAVAADWMEENGHADKAADLRSGLIPLANLDKDAAKMLSKARYAPGTFPKRFAVNAVKLVRMSPKQYRILWDLVYCYRKQIGENRAVVKLAIELHAERGLLWKQGRPTISKMGKIALMAPAFAGYEHLAGEDV